MALNSTEQIKTVIQQAKNILVLFHGQQSLDGAAAAIGLAEILEKLGKQVEVASDNWDSANGLKFLPPAAKIKPRLNQAQKLIVSIDLSEAKIDNLSYDLKDGQLFIYVTPAAGRLAREQVKTATSPWLYDLIFVLDCPDLESLGALYRSNQDLFSRVPVINIDHQAVNENFGQINLVDLKAAAVCEIIFDLLHSCYPEKISSDCATALLTGIIVKTKSFKTFNVNAQTLTKASQLLSFGARREEIIQHLFANRSVATLKLWGLALSRLRSEPDSNLLWLAVRAEDFLETETSAEDLPDLIEELISQSPAAKIVAILYESVGDNGARSVAVAVHTHDHYDAKILTKPFNPTGSKNSANFKLLNQNLAAAETQVISSIKQMLQTVY
jgi:phosphoesterase RecJ-like protein